MSSQAVDYAALEASTSVEEITENWSNRDILRSLKNDDLSALWLCAPDLADDYEDYVLCGSPELGWLGHFVTKSTRLESFGIHGREIFYNCSERSVERFFEDLGGCSHIKKIHFAITDLAGIIYKLGNAIKSNSITHWSMDGCFLGIPEATFLFNTFRDDMNSLEELHIDCDDGDEGLNDLDDNVMAGCIQSLTACTGMRKLNLNYLKLCNNSCAALSGIVPRIAALLELSLCGNSINDGSVEILACGLAACKHLRSLNLSQNRISDNGLDVLIQGLPVSVTHVAMGSNAVTLARQLPLLRFKKLDLMGNAFSLDGPRVIAASFVDPECRLEELNLERSNIGDEGVTTLVKGLQSNNRLARMYLYGSTITESGWNAFIPILCDTSSINATHGSNHTLQVLGGTYNLPKDVETLLHLNSEQDKSRVAAAKILRTHRHLDMRPLFGWEFGLLPYVIAWLERFAESRLDLKLSSVYEFVRAMPMKVTDRVVDKTKGKKRKLNS